jgi:hypothetical protein
MEINMKFEEQDLRFPDTSYEVYCLLGRDCELDLLINLIKIYSIV